jgi:hypothetical protein
VGCSAAGGFAAGWAGPDFAPGEFDAADRYRTEKLSRFPPAKLDGFNGKTATVALHITLAGTELVIGF